MATPTSKNYTEDELEILTEDERAGLLEMEQDEAELADDEEDEEPEQGTDKATADDPAAVAAAEAAAAEAEAKAKAKEDGQGVDAELGADDPVTPAAASAEPAPPVAVATPAAAPASPLPLWQMPANYAEQIAEIDAKKAALEEQFDSGDITTKEFRKQLDDLNRTERDLDQQKLKAEISVETRRNTYFTQVVPTFLAEHKEYAAGSPLHLALDHGVRALQAEALANGGDPMDPALLQKAHEQIAANLARVGINLGGPNAKPKAKSTERPEMPPTLANVPASDAEDVTDTGEFAELDRLSTRDTEAYEKALARLTPDQQERYLAS